MPPQRTIPPVKPVKTERTHEENQERAYIAASRRSDRSLEARVESARRASEIHKRRTGRSLRVTEQDVVNEEMYEEEDDDLPVQYRRLTAHLRTDSADFDRRLAAYLTNHVAMRSALDQAITSSYAQQYPNAPQFAHNQSHNFPSPLSPQQMRHAAAIHRQSPYPGPGSPAFPPPAHGRSASYASTPTMGPIPSPTLGEAGADRRMSLPTGAISPQSNPPMGPPLNTTSVDRGTLTTALPTETQQSLVAGLDPNDPLTSMFMAGSGRPPYYNFDSLNLGGIMNDGLPLSKGDNHPSFDGINDTLAPSALELNPTTPAPSSAPAFKTSFDGHNDAFPGMPNLTRHSSTQGSGIGDDWGAFINDNPWE
ncbi:MAG: hypothetical protein M1838_004135 [Thelocarpon superellum]|nr:MAG: hypothetical protein M1838_004135 [Thelocarpon superellum]